MDVAGLYKMELEGKLRQETCDCGRAELCWGPALPLCPGDPHSHT